MKGCVLYVLSTIVDTQTVLICFDCMVWFVAMSMFGMFVTGLLQSLYLPPAANPMKRRGTPSSQWMLLADPDESGFFPLLITFQPPPEADPQAGHRANSAQNARYFFRLPFRLHLRSLLATSPESMRGLVKIVQLSSTP